MRKFRIRKSLNKEVMIEFFSWVRFVEFDEDFNILVRVKNHFEQS